VNDFLSQTEDLRLRLAFYEEMRQLGYSNVQADSLFKIAKYCSASKGKLGAKFGSVAGAAITAPAGFTAIGGIITGAAVGFLVSTLDCVKNPAVIKLKYEWHQIKQELDNLTNWRFLTNPIDR
jgi:hypothetical protein